MLIAIHHKFSLPPILQRDDFIIGLPRCKWRFCYILVADGCYGTTTILSSKDFFENVLCQDEITNVYINNQVYGLIAEKIHFSDDAELRYHSKNIRKHKNHKCYWITLTIQFTKINRKIKSNYNYQNKRNNRLFPPDIHFNIKSSIFSNIIHVHNKTNSFFKTTNA